MMGASHFRELDVWQVAMELATNVYETTATFPREERFGLSAQLQRSAVSVASNIAEGNARGSTRDYARSISIARGSVAELQTQLLIAEQLGMGDKDRLERVLVICSRVGQMLLRLHQALEQKLLPESRVPNPESR